MLPITSHETQRALPSEKASARAVQPEDGGKFADEMHRAETASPHTKHSSKDVQNKATDSETDAGDEDVCKQENPGPQISGVVSQGKDTASVGATALPVKTLTKATTEKQGHIEGKHEKHAVANVAIAGVEVLEATSGVDTSLPGNDPQPVNVAVNAGVGVPSVAAVKLEKSAKKTADGGIASSAVEPGPELPVLQPACASAYDASPVNAGVDKPSAHGSSEMAKSVGLVERPEATTGAPTRNVMALCEVSGSPKQALSPAASTTHLASKASATTVDLTVQTYEASAGNKLEIGVSGGSWGWLKVRAEMGQSGEVHAFLRGASAGAEGELRAQAVDLQAYLGAQQLSVHGIHVEASRSAGWTTSAEANGDGGQRSHDGDARASREGAGSRMMSPFRTEDATEWMPLPRGLNGAGGWLNVLA